mmetsp:Transcript_144442/g.366670  ORF Transcript_144442/g.366670 Transcript_144442/m.366670 type:complete len:99 (+) Transcript_144442:177-473(+)
MVSPEVVGFTSVVGCGQIVVKMHGVSKQPRLTCFSSLLGCVNGMEGCNSELRFSDHSSGSCSGHRCAIGACFTRVFAADQRCKVVIGGRRSKKSESTP